MNRKLITAQIVVLAVLGVFLLAALILGLSGALGGLRLFGRGKVEVVHEQTVSAAGIERISLDFGSMDISVTVTDEEDIRIVQLAGAKLSPQEFFTLENVNGELRVSQKESRWFFNLFGFGLNQKLELYLPESYTRSLWVKTGSGDITLLSELAAEELSFHLSSGSLRGDAKIEGERIEAQVASGEISLGEVSCEEYEIGCSSGDIRLASLKGSGEIRSSSGNVSIGVLDGARHDLRASSGNIRLAGFSGSGSVQTHSGSIRMDCTALLGDLNLSASSGSVHLNLPQESSYELYASCASGRIDGNIPMSYSRDGQAATYQTGKDPYMRIDIETHSGNIHVDQGGGQ